jgi:hypothetical protein
MKDTIIDLARVSAITENVLYIIGKSLQRRALRNGVVVALAYGSALLGVKLSQGGLSPQQIASLLVAAFASYPLGTFLVLLSNFLARDSLNVATAGQLDLMAHYKQAGMRRHLYAAWNDVFRYESALTASIHDVINDRGSLLANRNNLCRLLGNLPLSLRKDLGLHQDRARDGMVDRILSSFPQRNLIEATRDSFVLTGTYALTSPLPQCVQEMECGFDVSVLEKWYRKGLFTMEDSLLKDFETDFVIKEIREILQPRPVTLAARFFDTEYAPSFWYSWTMRKLGICLGKSIRTMNRQLDLDRVPPYFNAQHFLWPCETLADDVLHRFGLTEGYRLLEELERTQRIFVHGVFSADLHGAHRLLYRLFEKNIRKTLALRLRVDVEYVAGELQRGPEQDLSRQPGPDWRRALPKRKLVAARKRVVPPDELMEKIARAVGHPIENAEAQRALRIAHFIDYQHLGRHLSRWEQAGAQTGANPDLIDLVQRICAAKAKVSAKLIRVRMFHLVARLQTELYVDLVEWLGKYGQTEIGTCEGQPNEYDTRGE